MERKKIHLKVGQKHYFEFGGYVESLEGNKLNIVSSRGDFIEVQSNPINTNGNTQLQNHYYNIVVRVKDANKYFSGFCVNKTPQHVHGLFINNYNPDKVVIKKKMFKKKKKTCT